jgi:hypothetical protein
MREIDPDQLATALDTDRLDPVRATDPQVRRR